MKRVLIALLVVSVAAGGLFVAGLFHKPTTPDIGVATASPIVASATATVAPASETAAPEGGSGATEAAAVAATPTATAEPSPSPTPEPLSLVTPQPVSTAEPAPTGPIDYLDLGRGAVVRRWTPAASDTAPFGLITKNGWRPRDGVRAPYEFVIELPAQTTLARFGVVANEAWNVATPDPTQTGATPGPSVSIAFATSTQSADGPYTDAATLAAGADDGTEHFADAAAPAPALFVRIRISAPAGVSLTRIVRIAGYGTQAALPEADLRGPWYQSTLAADSPWVDTTAGRLLTTPDPKKLAKLETTRWDTFGHGADTQFARCADGTESSVMTAFDDGSHRLIANRGDLRNVLTPLRESGAVADVEADETSSIFYRTNGPQACALLATAGTGSHRVAVLTRQNAWGSAYVPPDDLKYFPGYRFDPIFTPLFDPAVLSHYETLVFGSSCSMGLELMPSQTTGILDYVRAGHKLIIHDADTCREPNYSFLPYPTALSAAGAGGKSSNILDLIESDPLGTDKSDPKTFIDTDAFIADKTQQIGDGDVIYSEDPHWCGHLLTTNALGVSGYVQAYAHYGRGLIIYDGLDHDNREIDAFLRLMHLELTIPVTANLPCTHPTGGFLIDPAHSQREYVPGKNQRIAIGLSGVAILSFTGTIELSVSGPFAATLSVPSVTLKASRVPFGVLIDVPASARGGRHHFTVHGRDGAGHTSDAQIDLVPGKTSALERALQATGRITLHDILFDTASAKIRPASYAVLGQIADALGRNPKWRLRIDGHTDNVGGAPYNLDLSQRRAASVKTTLVKEFHIDAGRLRTAGYGLTKPVASNASDTGRQLNRRVELVRI